MTSQPGRRNYKTGRPGGEAASASKRAGAAQWRARRRPTPTRHRLLTYRGRRHDAGDAGRARARARGLSTRRAALRSAGAGALSAAASARRRRRPPHLPARPARRSRTHQNDEFIFRARWPFSPRTLPRVPRRT